jgi:hypothetical protein
VNVTVEKTLDLEERLAQRYELKVKKQDNKRRKLELAAERLEMEKSEKEQRLALEERRTKAEENERDANRQLMLAIAQNLNFYFVSCPI